MGKFHATFNTDNTFNATFDDGGQMSAEFDSTQVVETADYNKLSNKPSINEVELQGNKSFDDLGDHTLSNIEIKTIFDRVFKGE